MSHEHILDEKKYSADLVTIVFQFVCLIKERNHRSTLTDSLSFTLRYLISTVEDPENTAGWMNRINSIVYFNCFSNLDEMCLRLGFVAECCNVKLLVKAQSMSQKV